MGVLQWVFPFSFGKQKREFDVEEVGETDLL